MLATVYEQNTSLNAGYRLNGTHSFKYGQDMWTARLPPGSQFVRMGGKVPCCIDANVPAQNGTSPGWPARVSIGKVLGICDPATNQASITWLGAIYPQDIARAQLLTMDIYKKPGGSQSLMIPHGVH